jgi:hypothetical protein
MSITPWDEMTRGWAEMYDQHAEMTKTWLAGQTQLANTLGGLISDDTNPMADATAMGELWRSWTALGGSLGRTFPGVSAGGGIAAETLGRMTDPLAMSLAGGGEVGNTIRRMTEGPRFADIGAAEHRMAKLMELWISVQTAARTYEGVVAGAWMTANQRFARDISSRSDAGTQVKGSKQALRLWLEIANQTLIETHRSPEFLEAQQKLLRQGMEFLLAEREFVETLVEPAGLPTRTELDEVHSTVLGLKRRVRALERAAAQQVSTSQKPKPRSPRGATATTAQGATG